MIVATKHGRFTIDGLEIVINAGDTVPQALESAAIAQGWGKKSQKPATKKAKS